MASENYGVPRLLWESFETLLYNESKRYVKDLANILEVNPETLLRQVMPSRDKVKVYLQDPTDSATELACKAFVGLAGGDLAARCSCPVTPHTKYCSAHQHNKPSIQTRMDCGLPIPKYVRRLRTGPELPTLWVDDDGLVWDAELNPAGKFNPSTGELVYAVFSDSAGAAVATAAATA